MIDYSKFQHCLRVQLKCDDLSDERIDTLVNHCVEYGFNNVMLLVNAEEFCLGHITIDEARPWVELLKKAKKRLTQAGITVSVNNWMEMGHVGRARKLKPGQNFTTMVDRFGKDEGFVACPLDEQWQKYFLDYVSFLVRELKPEVFWIEDDMRYHNHGKLNGGGCFCEKHMREFSRRLGRSVTREEFVKRVFVKGKITPERRVWIETSRDSLLELVRKIGDSVTAISPKTDIGLMSSGPVAHCIEGREWKPFLKAMSSGNKKINRIHLPLYQENIPGKIYIYNFNGISMAVRHFCEEDTLILPEIENGPANRFFKDPRTMRFQLESAIPLVLSGMTYSLYDFVGNGAVDGFGYAKHIKELTPYLQAVKDTDVKFSELTGVVVPIDEKTAYHRVIKNDWLDLAQGEFIAASYLGAMGIGFRYSTEKEFCGETVALFGDNTYDFTDEQLENLFKNNFVMVDGGCVLNLKERKLLRLIGAESAELIPAESGGPTYEEIEGEKLIYGIKKFRATCRSWAGDFVQIAYDSSPDEVLASTYNEFHKKFADGYVRHHNCFIIPFVIKDLYCGQFSEMRRIFWSEFVLEKSKCAVVTEYAGVTPYLYSSNEKFVLMLVNSTVENFSEISFKLKGFSPSSVKLIGKDGVISDVEYIYKDGKITVKSPFEYLSTVTLICKRG